MMNLKDFSFLNQKGPKTLNALNKKKYFKNIDFENMHLRNKINGAKSDYGKAALSQFTQKINTHQNILLIKSPSKKNIDPLIERVKS